MEVTCTLLVRWRSDNVRLVELLRAVCALMAHRRYAEAMVAAGGVPLLLSLPQNPHTAGKLLCTLCVANLHYGRDFYPQAIQPL